MTDLKSTSTGLPWDRITAVSSVIIALLALASSVHQAALNRRLNREMAESQREFQKQEADASRLHRKLSVKPRLVYKRDLAYQSERPGILLENRGLGPAEIYDLAIFRGQDLVGRGDSEESMLALLEEFGINSNVVRWHAILGSYTVLPGDDIQIFGTTAEAYRDPNWYQRFTKAMKDMEIGYCYCSIYEQCWKHSAWASSMPAPDRCEGVVYTEDRQ